MSNKASNQLHELIKSMSSAEKRYFKLYSERHPTKEKKTYINLFDEIDRQETYDEALLIQRLGNTPATRHLSIAKNRLYHHVLRSLDSYHAQQNVDAELHQYLHYAAILFDKTLYSQCDRILNSALKIALKHERYAVVLQIVNRRKRLAETENFQNGRGSDIQEIHELESNALHMLMAESALWQVKSEIFETLFRKGHARDATQVAALRQALDTAAATYADKALSLEATYLWGQARSAYHFATGAYEETARVLTTLVETLETRMEQAQYEPGMYISALTNLVYVSAKLNRFDDVNTWLYKARNLPNAMLARMNEDLDLRIFTNTYSIELAICNLTGNVERGLALLSELEGLLGRWEPLLSPVRRAGFYHAMCTMYFVAGDVKKALYWNNALLNHISIEKSEDLYCFAAMVHLLLHYELGNLDLMPYGLKSLSRYLDTRERKYRFEQLFTGLVKQLMKPLGREDTKALLHEFSEAVSALENDPFEKHVLEYFDFQAWADWKATGVPMRDILLRKAPAKDVL
jgi:hypothetical protein